MIRTITTWSYDEGEMPQALKDEIGTAVVEYISSPQISKELEHDSTPKKVGWRMRLMGQTLEMDDKETYDFYSNNSTWDLEAFKRNGFDELYREVTNRND
jgi:hypothetical protein